MRHTRNFSWRGELPAPVRKTVLALGATAALLGGPTLSQAQAQQQRPTFSAYPMPGTPTVSPGTNISFRGGNAAALGTITVTGSKSGKHAGTLQAHSDGLGVSFVPDKAFARGETVTVTTSDNVVNAANGDFSFAVGESTGRKNRFPEPVDVGKGTIQRYATRPDLIPPSFIVTTAKPGRAPGL